MDEHHKRRAARKVVINGTISLVCTFLPGVAGGLDDPKLAFTISTVSIHVAIGTAMMVLVWLCYFEYISGDLGDGDYEPIPAWSLLKSTVYGLLANR